MIKIGIIGAGRVGCAFAVALFKKGAEISGIYGRSSDASVFQEDRLGKVFSHDLRRTVEAADVIMLTVPDAVIGDISKTIAMQCSIGNKYFFQCSGALTSDILEPLKSSGAHTGSLHPIQTFADKENGWRDMYGIWFGYEGSSEASEKALEIVALLDGSMLSIEQDSKPLYHAAACILSNYMVTLSYVSGMLLGSFGIGKDDGLKAFMPLLRNTVENLDRYGVEKALTGPIARGDTVTIESHIAALEKQDRGISDVYKSVGIMTAKLACEKGSIDQKKYEDIINLLREG